VHKSQGSEFDAVDVIVDATLARGLNRQLLYTAMTRARADVRLWCSEEALALMIATRLRRRSGIVDVAGAAHDPVGPGSAAGTYRGQAGTNGV